MESPQVDPLAIVSLVIGIISWIGTCCSSVIFAWLSAAILPFSIAGAICGFVSMRRIRAEPEFYGGQSAAIIGFVLNLLLTLSIFLMLALSALVIFGIVAIPFLDAVLSEL